MLNFDKEYITSSIYVGVSRGIATQALKLKKLLFQRTTGPVFMFKYKSQMTGSNMTNQMLQLNLAQKVQAFRQSDCQTPALR